MTIMRPIETLGILANLKFEHDSDDLDFFIGGAFKVDETAFSLVYRYLVQPPGTDVYLSASLHKEADLIAFAEKLAEVFSLAASDIVCRESEPLSARLIDAASVEIHEPSPIPRI